MITPLIGPRELAQILGVKLGTVFSWMSRGIDLPPSIKIAGTTRWDPKDVEAWKQRKKKERARKNFED